MFRSKGSGAPGSLFRRQTHSQCQRHLSFSPLNVAVPAHERPAQTALGIENNGPHHLCLNCQRTADGNCSGQVVRACGFFVSTAPVRQRYSAVITYLEPG